MKRIEERRKIQNKMRALMEEQHMKDERIQEEKDRVIRKEVLVERDPARKQTFAEYSPFRNREKGKPETWVSATVLAATGKMQQHRYMQTPPKKMNPLKVEVSRSPSYFNGKFYMYMIVTKNLYVELLD